MVNDDYNLGGLVMAHSRSFCFIKNQDLVLVNNDSPADYNNGFENFITRVDKSMVYKA